jgi:hypothetical protein
MENIKEIFIANTAEAFADLLEQRTPSSIDQKNRIKQETDLSQRAHFWGGDNKVIITPSPIPATLLEHNTKIIGYKNIKNLWPKNFNIRLCKSILEDRALIKDLIGISRANQGVRLSSYSVTADYIDLLRFLVKKANWQIINLPKTKNPLDLVKSIDTKDGFREIVADLLPQENLKLPNSFICQTEADVVRAISNFLDVGKGFVIKVHNGESGWGVKIIDNDSIHKLPRDKIKISGWLHALFESDSIWNFAPYVVEEFISVDKKIGGGFPSGEGHITDDGFMFDYLCGQEVSEDGSFEGVILSSDIVPGVVSKNIKIGMKKVGKSLYSKGYRGTFDIDFAAGQDGNLYFLESNARITGGTHVYNLISYLGLDRNKHVISNDSFCYNAPSQKPEILFKLLFPFLYPIQNKKRGIIISFVSLDRPVIGIITIGANKQDTNFLIEKAKDCLSIN